MGGAGWRTTTSTVNAAHPPTTHGRRLAALPCRLAVAVHLGASLRRWVGSMGLASRFIIKPAPVCHVAHNGLPTFVHGHTFNSDGLLSLGAVFLERIHLG
jgi:hypothetical protein